MINVEIKSNIKFPELKFQSELMYIAKTIFIPNIQAGIDSGMAINGGQFPPLEPSTIAKKRGQTGTKQRTTAMSMGAKNIHIAGYGTARTSGSTSADILSTLGGISGKTLVDTGKLRKSFVAAKIGKDSVSITLDSDRSDIGSYLQSEGIRSKHGLKHFNFFGISEIMEELAMNYMRKKVGDKLNA